MAIVIPHHNLVASTRQQFLKTIAQQRPFTRHIILLSPDHFSPRQYQLTSSSRNWNLSTGTAVYNNFLNLDLTKDDSLLQNDHGIYNPLADLKTYFPKADYFPVLIGQKTTATQLQTLLNHINQYCHFDCLLVTSVDFSHYLPAALAEVHDAFTLTNLQNFHLPNLLKSEVDSPQSLYLLSSFSQNRHAKSWNLFAHTNSGLIARNPDVETTTHIFGYYTRRFFHNSSVTTSTTLPYPLDRSLSQVSLGDRFFYGVDNFSISSASPNFVVSETNYPSKTVKSFLPLKDNYFIRGTDKQNLIKNYFDTIPNQPHLTKDYFWGKLIYEKKE